jgi:hypothetical protein
LLGGPHDHVFQFFNTFCAAHRCSLSWTILTRSPTSLCRPDAGKPW